MEEYGEYVSEGTRPHRPPISAIAGWSRRKGLNPWAVAANIEKYGTLGNDFLEPLNQFEAEYFKKLDNEVFESVESFVWDRWNELINNQYSR